MPFANGYTYRRSISVYAAKVPADAADFPVLVAGTYSYLAHTDHGGRCTDANGYDIAFYADEAGTTPLYWEIESYNHETGAVIFWVKVDLDHDAATVFYLFYSNSSVSTFQSTATAVWSVYSFVYHMGESGATLEDSTTSNLDGTKDGATAPAQNTSGKIGACQNFTSDQILTMDSTSPTAYTQSMWVKFDAGIETQAIRSIVVRTSSAGPLNAWSHQLRTVLVDTFCRLSAYLYDGGAPATNGTTNLVKDVWYHVAATAANNGNLTIYLNGVYENQVAIGTMWTGGDRWAFGPVTGYGYAFPGDMDEVRYARSVLPATWLLTEYNNQSDPSTFYELGAEEQSGTLVELAGQSDGGSTAAGTLQVTRLLAGTSAGGSTVAGALGVTLGLAGRSDGLSTLAGALQVTRGLAGRSDGVSTVAGVLRVTRLLAGVSAGGSVVTGALSIRSIRRLFATPPSGTPRVFGSPPSGGARIFDDAPAAGAGRVFKQ